MDTLRSTNPFYVRCIKPNVMQQANIFDNELVLTQLRYAGMLETVRIRKMGFPFRYPLQDFFNRYFLFLFCFFLTKHSLFLITNITNKPDFEELCLVQRNFQAGKKLFKFWQIN